MIRMNISADSDALQQLAMRLPAFFGGKVAPATKAAFDASARYIQAVWKGWAMGDPIDGIPNIKRPNQKLANSIKIAPVSPFAADIITESPYMRRIVEGTPAMDMKKIYPYGRKSRVSKDGVPYLIIPFRWGTPNKDGEARAHFGNMIPVKMYEIIKAFKMQKSFRLDKREDGSKAVHSEANYSGEPIERSEYQWGERLEADGDANGMVRMGSETKQGGSSYFTFRIISRDSPADKWWKKEIPPVNFENALKETVRPIVEDMVRAGLEADFGI